MKITLDLDKSGLFIVFKDWEIDIIDHLLKNRESDSKAVYLVVKDKISRASVINFLEHMKELGFLDVNVESTRGGWKGMYKMRDYFVYDYEIMYKIFNTMKEKMDSDIEEMRFPKIKEIKK